MTWFITFRASATKPRAPSDDYFRERTGLAAYHSVLIFNVLGVSDMGENGVPVEIGDEVEQPLHDLMDTYRGLTVRNVLESYHDARSRPSIWP